MLLPSRQVHLDFHTSEHIPGVAANFDATAFAATVAAAHINSMTVFARCHHGWLYYPSKKFAHLIHPELQTPDLLLQQIDALHAAGIRAPVYTTLQWDYQSARTHPEWLVRHADGTHTGSTFDKPGFYQTLCTRTGYADHFIAMLEDLMDALGPDRMDGFFFDITGIRSCWCDTCRALMTQRGIDADDETVVHRLAHESIDAFKHRVSQTVRARAPGATIFYNAGHIGPCTRESADSYSHFELESLPGGAWGYQHFPTTARYAHTLGKDCLGMTGKFHDSWGDFHSLRSRAALEYECLRALAMGYGCSIGDQLPPDGALNPATYQLIGGIYRTIEAYEPFARPSRPVVEAAVVSGEHPDIEHAIPEAVTGAMQALQELAVQFDIIDPDQDFAKYPLLILPDGLVMDEALCQKIDAYAARGGKVLCTLDATADALPHCLGAKTQDSQAMAPDFFVAEGPLATDLYPGNEYVIYERGCNLTPTTGETILSCVSPHFERGGNRFCSHGYTPSAGGPAKPAAIATDNTLTIARPLFGQYQKNAPWWVKTLVRNALNQLLPARLTTHDGPSFLECHLREQEGRYVLHLLSYMPWQKSAQSQSIEEPIALHKVQVQLRPDLPIASAALAPELTPLALEGNMLTVDVNGYACVVLAKRA